MSVKYNMQEINDLNGGGKMLHPKMVRKGVCEMCEVSRLVAARCTAKEPDVKAVVAALAQVLAERMAEGYSVRLDGVGMFSASLALRPDKEREVAHGTHRNSWSVEVGKVNFRADKQLLGNTRGACRLERTTGKFARSSAQFTPQERMDMLKGYIEAHGSARVSDYVALTGLACSTATKELARWAATAGSGIARAGRGPLTHYVAGNAGALAE